MPLDQGSTNGGANNDSSENAPEMKDKMRIHHNGCMSYSTSTVAGVIIVTEFCERLAYYGLAGSLVLFFQ